MLLEFPEKDNATKANILAHYLKLLFPSGGELIIISRRIEKIEVRISLHEFVTLREVAASVALAVDCEHSGVQTRDIRQTSPECMGPVWLKCPTAADKKIATSNSLTVGCVSAGWQESRSCHLVLRCATNV